jgi:hypothetical protein
MNVIEAIESGFESGFCGQCPRERLLLPSREDHSHEAVAFSCNGSVPWVPHRRPICASYNSGNSLIQLHTLWIGLLADVTFHPSLLVIISGLGLRRPFMG